MLRDNKFGVYTAADAFISLIWHAMLMYWAVLALNKGWHVGWPEKHSVGMSVTSDAKPRHAATVNELIDEQSSSQTRMRSCAYRGSR